MTPLIRFEHVTKRFPGVTALNEVSFEIIPGEIHAIVGENGAGKSTLMKLLAGVISDFEGRLFLREAEVRFADTRGAERAGISIIHQELNLVEDLSAAANIFLGREKLTRLGLLDDRRMEAEAASLLAQLECHVPAWQTVRQLRVGDQQLVEIAKALSLQADILIMDEPTSALTSAEADRLFRIMRRLQQRGVTILYISHKMDEVFALADRISVLRDGRLVKTLTRQETNVREVTHLMVGREIESVRMGVDRKLGDVALEVEGLSLAWPGHARGWRLRDISFRVRSGEVLGIAGLMGAGRTELLECLFGASAERPRGRIMLGGRERFFSDPAEACAAGVAMITEDRKRSGLFEQMSVAENITICTLREDCSGGLLSRRHERQRADRSVREIGIKTPGLSAAITMLSGGNQQKVIIGRWLSTKPKLLLLDDPTRGVDVGGKAELYRLINKLAEDGLAIIVTSSELPELLTLCNRILVLCEGQLTGEFSRTEATEQRIMEAATNRQLAAYPAEGLGRGIT